MKKWRIIALMMIAVLMLSMLGGCSSNNAEEETSVEESEAENPADKEPIQIATKVTAEQYILGEMLALLIEDNLGYKSEITKGLGDAPVVQPALESGEFDLYPEYTGSAWSAILGYDPSGVSNDEMFEGLKEEYQEKWNITWLGLYGFNNTFAVIVSKDIAEKYDLKTISDLAPVSDQLRFAANPTYLEREDAFPALAETYGLNFKSISEVDISLRYAAIENDEADVSVAFTTDAQLEVADVVVLEDDLNAMAAYYCSTVVRQDTLEEYPGLEETLMKMDGILTDEEMSALNYEVEVNERDEKDVAREFLISKGLIEE